MEVLDVDLLTTDLVNELVASVWDSGFLKYDAISQQTEDYFNDNFYFCETFMDIRNGLIQFSKQSSTEDGLEFWRKIADEEPLKRNLIALLFYFIEQGRQAQQYCQKESSVLAADVYLTLLRIPGSNHIQFFHPIIYQKCLDSLNIILLLYNRGHVPGKRKRTGSSQSSQQKSQSQSKRKKLSLSRQSSLSQQLFDETSDDVAFSEHEIMKLQLHSLHLNKTLILLLRYNTLKSYNDLSEMTINMLSKLTCIEPAGYAAARLEESTCIEKIDSVCHLAYLGLLLLCNRNEGASVAMVKQTLRVLDRNLLMLVGEKRDHPAAQSIPREIVMVKDQTLDFILKLMEIGGTNINHPIKYLVRSVILATPDRSEYRTKIAQVVQAIMGKMSDPMYTEMCKWLFQLSKYKRASGRMMSVEIFAQLLVSTDFRRIKDCVLDPDLLHYTARSTMLQVVLIRCSDKSPSVMARALSVLASCLNSDEIEVSQDFRGMITPHPSKRAARITSQTDMAHSRGSAVGSECFSADVEDGLTSIATEGCARLTSVAGSESRFSGADSQASTVTSSATAFHLTKGINITLPDSQGLVSLIMRRMLTTKAIVRKSALQALESVIKYNNCIGMEKELDTIKEHCRDTAVPIRKQAILSLTQLLQLYPENATVQRIWLSGVLPTHEDNESSVQEKCWDCVKTVLINGITDNNDDKASKLAWKLCSLLNTPTGVAQRHLLQAICEQLHKRGELPSGIVSSTSRYVATSRNKDAWMLLSIFCPITSTKDPKTANLIASHWLENSGSLTQSDTVYILSTMSILAPYIEKNTRESIITDLLTRIKAYNQPACVIKYLVVATLQLKAEENGKAVWVKDIIQDVERVLSSLIYSDNYDGDKVSRLPIYLVTLGEVCLYNPQAVSTKLIRLVQSLVMLSKESDGQSTLLQDMLSGKLPVSLRRSAILCLGKICIQHEFEAKQSIPSLAKELESSEDPVIKQTIITILCDLCRLYTNSVGPYVSCMATSLKDKSVDVRKSTFIAMIRLLQEDFLKFKGSLFYRFLSCLVDDDAQVANLAKQAFIYELSRRNKTLYSQHFVECVFHFNDYMEHKTYNRFSQTESERKVFSLTGEQNSSKRFDIYAFMLLHMTDAQKFNVTQKLCHDVLSAAVEKELPIKSPEAASVLIDSLKILESKEIKLSVTKAAAAAETEVEEDLPASQAAATTARVAHAATNITKLVKKNFVETAIPEIIALKQLLESAHSPILKHLMLFLIEITKDYKSELADIFSANPQLASEIAFDIKKFEEMKERASALEATVSARDETLRANPLTNSVRNTPVMAKAPLNNKTPATSYTPAIAERTPRAPGTPALPPPPLRSAIKKPTAATTRHLIDSAKKMSELNDTSVTLTTKAVKKRVNFGYDEEGEDADVIVGHSQTPLRPAISAAVGARAISTPDGQLGDLTFVFDKIMACPSPILGVNNILNNTKDKRPVNTPVRATRSTSNQRVAELQDDPLTNIWKVKSPLSKSKSKSRTSKIPMPVDITDDNGLEDVLVSMPVAKAVRKKSSRRTQKPANQDSDTENNSGSTTRSPRRSPRRASESCRSELSVRYNDKLLDSIAVVQLERLTPEKQKAISNQKAENRSKRTKAISPPQRRSPRKRKNRI